MEVKRKHAEEEQPRPWGGVPCTSDLDRVPRRRRRSVSMSRPFLEGLETPKIPKPWKSLNEGKRVINVPDFWLIWRAGPLTYSCCVQPGRERPRRAWRRM